MSRIPDIPRVAALAAAVSAAVSAPVFADDALMLEEVVVTAQKREQSLQDVPISVTAFTQEFIDRAGINDFSAYAVKTPNLGFQQRGSRADTRFSIRGITNIGGRASSVGMYVDEVNVVPNVITTGASRTADLSLLDVERIEILRGPQGTFFGRNTMGGAINITTQKPVLDDAFGQVTVEAGEDEYYHGRVSGNIGLGDAFALRGAAYYEEDDGFIDNKGPSGSSNAIENKGARLALRWQPGDDLTADFTASYSKMEQDYPAMVPTGILAEIPSAIVDFLGDPIWPLTDVDFFPDNYTDTATDMARPEENETWNLSARIQWDLDSVRLVSVTGYIDNDYESSGEGDASVSPAFTVGRESDMTAFSQEFRLSSLGNDSVHWMVGAIYSDDETNETDISTHLETDPFVSIWDLVAAVEFGLPFAPGVSIGNFEDVDRGSETTSYAVFGDVSWDVTEHWVVAAGLRYTYDEVEYYELTRPTITIPEADISDDEDFDDFSPRLNVSWLPNEDLTIYSTISKGYKVGGFNANQDLVDLFFDEETGWNYEIGFKSTFWDQRVMLNSAIFYFDWDDLQIRGQDVRTQRQVVVNADSAHSQGLEIELKALLTERLSVDMGYGYLESEFDNAPDLVDTDGNLFDGDGNTIPLSPENTFNAGIEYEIELFGGDTWARLDYSYIDDQYTSPDNVESREIESYELWNLRIGYDREHFGIQAFVENLGDEEYSSGTENLETFYTGLQRTVGRGRWAGVRLDIKF